MQELMDNFLISSNRIIDHTSSNLACLSAVALGASVLEKHFTDHMNEQGQILFVLWMNKKQEI